MDPDQGRDPIALLLRQETNRLPWLVPMRHSRMAANPFAFFRGAAVVMAADLAREPHSELMVQLCGDAHLLNFGFYGSPERQLLFDINDFDETHPGPFEWDVVRLATSLLLAARSLGLDDKRQSKVCRHCVQAYAEAMDRFSAMPFMAMWVARLHPDELIDQRASGSLRAHLEQVIASALQRDSRQAVRKLCERNSAGELQFRHDPPLLWRSAELPASVRGEMDWRQRVSIMFSDYLGSIRPEMRRFLSNFRLQDSAIKAVGVGSVGTRCALRLFVGDHSDDVLVLQSKQAEPSVLAPFLNQPVPMHEGERVVQGQRLMQTASDAFLGWTTTPEGYHLYWRHFRDWKGSVELTRLDARGLKDYGALCGWTLAKAHARSGDRRAISSYMGEPKVFASMLWERALTHAHHVELDHRTFVEAIDAGGVEVSELA